MSVFPNHSARQSTNKAPKVYYAQPPLPAGSSVDRRSGAKAPPSVKLGTTVLFSIAAGLGGREGARPVPLYSVTQAWAAGVAQGAVNKGCDKFLNQWAITIHACAPGYNDAIALTMQLPDKTGSWNKQTKKLLLSMSPPKKKVKILKQTKTYNLHHEL